jgi:DNA-binding transcriptional MerR regulator
VAEQEFSDTDEVTTGVAAKIVGVSHSTLLRYTKAGRIRPVSRTLERGDRRYLVADARALRDLLRAKATEDETSPDES